MWGVGGRSTYELRRTLSITHGIAWQGHVDRFLRSKAAATQPQHLASDAAELSPALTVHTLETPALKGEYLDELRVAGFTGLHEFLHAFISSLAKRAKLSTQMAHTSK